MMLFRSVFAVQPATFACMMCSRVVSGSRDGLTAKGNRLLFFLSTVLLYNNIPYVCERGCGDC